MEKSKLIEISTSTDIPDSYRDTPIGLLLEYHNLNKKQEAFDSANLLVGMCMDNRKKLNIPDNFAFILRTGGSNMLHNEFHISYAIAIAALKHMVIIGHSDCGMVDLNARKDLFVDGLVNNAGWDKQNASNYFSDFSPKFEITNAVDFTLQQVKSYREKFPKQVIAPLFYRVEDRKLYLINE